MVSTAPTPFGHVLRQWRSARRLSQLALASRAETPPRHVSFLETGRARPSREMVLRLATALDLPLPEHNRLLVAAGFSPAYAERALDDAALAPIRFVIARMLASHTPYPAVVLDRWYDILDANPAGRLLFLGGAPLDPDDPPNLVELLLGPFRERIVNWPELVHDGLIRLRREAADALDDHRLHALLERVERVAAELPLAADHGAPSPVLCTRIRHGDLVLTTLSTLVHFGGSRDVTVDGLHLELVYPADELTDRVLRELGASPAPSEARRE